MFSNKEWKRTPIFWRKFTKNTIMVSPPTSIVRILHLDSACKTTNCILALHLLAKMHCIVPSPVKNLIRTVRRPEKVVYNFVLLEIISSWSYIWQVSSFKWYTTFVFIITYENSIDLVIHWSFSLICKVCLSFLRG
jgi:hypothetical protein